MSNNMEMLVRLGRFMITHAPQFADDITCNRWARAGQLLTGLGMPFAPKLREFEVDDQNVVKEAAAVMAGRNQMPPKLQFHEPTEPKRTRKARMTRVMTKPVIKVTKTREVKAERVMQADAIKRRGRPAGSKNKPKVVVKATKILTV